MPRFTMRQMMALVLAACVVITSLIFPSGWVAGIVLVMTLLAVVVASLGVIDRRGNDRAWCLGFASFGWGYMALASSVWWYWYVLPPGGGFRPWTPRRPNLPTSAILDQLHPIFLRDRGPGPFPVAIERLFAAPRDRAILDKLALPLAPNLPYPSYPTIEALARSIAEATRDRAAGLPEGIPIDLDPQGLQDADRTPSTTLTLARKEGVPLGQTLGFMLDRLDLLYDVRGGRLTITGKSIGDKEIGAFLRVGHCYLAIAAGWFGATASRCSFKAMRRAGVMGSEFDGYAFRDLPREKIVKFARQYEGVDMARLMGADEENFPFLIRIGEEDYSVMFWNASNGVKFWLDEDAVRDYATATYLRDKAYPVFDSLEEAENHARERGWPRKPRDG